MGQRSGLVSGSVGRCNWDPSLSPNQTLGSRGLAGAALNFGKKYECAPEIRGAAVRSPPQDRATILWAAVVLAGPTPRRCLVSNSSRPPALAARPSGSDQLVDNLGIVSWIERFYAVERVGKITNRGGVSIRFGDASPFEKCNTGRNEGQEKIN